MTQQFSPIAEIASHFNAAIDRAEQPKTEPQMDCPGCVLITKQELYAVMVVDVAREKGLEAEWGRDGFDYDTRTGMPKGGATFYAEVFETTAANFDQIRKIASQRMLP